MDMAEKGLNDAGVFQVLFFLFFRFDDVVVVVDVGVRVADEINQSCVLLIFFYTRYISNKEEEEESCSDFSLNRKRKFTESEKLIGAFMNCTFLAQQTSECNSHNLISLVE